MFSRLSLLYFWEVKEMNSVIMSDQEILELEARRFERRAKRARKRKVKKVLRTIMNSILFIAGVLFFTIEWF